MSVVAWCSAKLKVFTSNFTVTAPPIPKMQKNNLLSFVFTCLDLVGTDTSAEILSLSYVCLFDLFSKQGVLRIVHFSFTDFL